MTDSMSSHESSNPLLSPLCPHQEESERIKDQVTSLTEQLDEIEKINSELLLAKKEIELQRDSLLAEVDTLKKTLAQAQSRQSDTQKLVSVLRGEMDRLKKSKNTEAQAEVEQLHHEIQRLEEENSKLSQNNNEMQEKIRSMADPKGKEAELRLKIDQIQFERDHEKRQFTDLQQEFAKTKELADRLQEEKRESESMNEAGERLKEIERLKKELSNKDQQHKTEVDCLHEQISSLISTQRQFQERSSPSKTKTLTDPLNPSSMIYQDEVDDLQTELRQKEDELIQLRSKLDLSEREVNNKTQQLAQSKRREEELERENKDKETSLQRLREERDSRVKGTTTETRVLLERIRMVEDDNKKTKQRTEDELKKIELERMKWTQQLADGEKQVEDMKKAISEKDDRIRSLQLLTQQQKDQVEAAERIEREKKMSEAMLSESLRSNFTQEKDQIKERLYETEKELVAVKGENEQNKRRIERLTREIEIERKVLQAEVRSQRAKNDEYERENRMLKDTMEQTTRYNDELNRTNRSTEGEKEQLEQTRADLERDVMEVASLKENLSHLYNSLLVQQNVTATETQAVKEQYRVMETQLMTLRDELTAKEEEWNDILAKKDAEIIQLTRSLNSEKKKVSEMTIEMEGVTEFKDSNLKLHRNLRSENAILKDTQDRLKNELDDLHNELHTFKTSFETAERARVLAVQELEETKEREEEGNRQMNAQIRNLTKQLNEVTVLAKSRERRLAELENLYDQSTQASKQLLNENLKLRMTAETTGDEIDDIVENYRPTPSQSPSSMSRGATTPHQNSMRQAQLERSMTVPSTLTPHENRAERTLVSHASMSNTAGSQTQKRVAFSSHGPFASRVPPSSLPRTPPRFQTDKQYPSTMPSYGSEGVNLLKVNNPTLHTSPSPAQTRLLELLRNPPASSTYHMANNEKTIRSLNSKFNLALGTVGGGYGSEDFQTPSKDFGGDVIQTQTDELREEDDPAMKAVLEKAMMNAPGVGSNELDAELFKLRETISEFDSD
ncbi:hypothetical protein BLNAU_4420 [Blattamonas nauphoetae]|uniref:Uncharacterized protein n=1 Tax=Blattamonas nauphoetae TaxID=2049346 RepID=A0ABQ9Y9U0_9EUKA|nr:hypothetical protein BLNAU_4420 [Blattamonas nauphoetae]